MARREIDLTTPQPNGKMGEPTKSAWQKTNDNFEDLYSLLGPSAISPNGLMMSFSGSTITVSEGYAYIPSMEACLVVAQSLSMNLSGMIQNTWYHLYVFDNSGIAAFEVVTASPSAPYYGRARTKIGDPTRRYIGSIRVGAEGVHKFEHHGNMIQYLEDTRNAPFLVLGGGGATITTTVSTAQVVPVTAYAASLTVLNVATNGAYIRLSNSNGPSAQSGYISLASPGGVTSSVMPLNSSQSYTYAFDNTPAPAAAGFHRVNGYYFER